MYITGIILAGGKSRRMGTDKALLEINKKKLLQHAIAFCSPFCTRLLISSNHKEHQKFGIEIIPDDINNCGPLGGIYSCLKQSETDWNFVLSVDSVFVEHEFIQEMIKARGNYSAIVPLHSGGKEPLIALYHKKAISDIKTQLETGNYKMNFLLEKVNTHLFDSTKWIEKYPKLFHNANYPEDLIF